MHATAAVLLLAGSIVPAAAAAGGLERLEYGQTLMGVPVRILVYARDKEPANAAVHAAFDRIRQLNLIFSDYDEDSEISRLTRRYTPGQPLNVSAELATVLAASLEMSRRSEGAFDVTIGPLVGLWRASRRTKRLPTAEQLAAAKKRVGYEAVHVDVKDRTVTLDKPGIRLDFGGIVKGFAADEARTVLAAHGFKQTLVALSGDISVGDSPPGESGWKIGVAGPETPGEEPRDFVLLSNVAVSTAGDAFQFVEIAGKRYSHLVDPKTGLGITRRVSVTVIARTGLLSDGLDSAAAILGPEKGISLLKNSPGVSARFVELTEDRPKSFEIGDFSRYLVKAQPAHR
jgi:thiamine biosynthesis lipoprotein